MSQQNLLLSCAGRRVELLHIWERTFRELGMDSVVLATDAQPFAPAFVLAQRQAIVPRCKHPDFVTRMLKLCEIHHIRWVVPTIDTELPILAAARAQQAQDRQHSSVIYSERRVIRAVLQQINIIAHLLQRTIISPRLLNP